jgi:beta-xylosidase
MMTLLAMLVLFSAPASARAITHAQNGSFPSHKAVPTAAATYSNPIIAQTTPDPAIIKALDGYYYTIATSDSWQDGSFHILPIYRSTDLVHWTFVGDSFPARPAWVQSTAGLWAPDLQYYNHKYYMYYTASNTNPLPKYGTTSGSAIGVATADSPAGPWTDVGDSAGGSYAHGPIVPPRPCAFNTDPNCYYATIDPAEFTDHDNQKYMYYGSYFGGTLVQKMTPDGLHVTGPAIQVGHWDRYEGTYVIRHDVNGQAYYYNFSSSADCCSGPNSGYSVVVNRAKSPLGPFIDQHGFPMERPAAQPAPTKRPSDDPAGDNFGAQGGGYPTLKQNGNQWHGIGHNAIITDLSGQDWIIYHGIDANNGWVNGLPAGVHIVYRQLLMDRIDWTADGWPVVNDGAGPSLTHAAPVTTPIFGDNFNAQTGCAAAGNGNDLSTNWRAITGTWGVNPGTCTTGGYAEQTSTQGQSLLVSKATTPAGYRAECDLRLEQAGANGRYGCLASYRQTRNTRGTYIAAFIDPAKKDLITVPYQNGQVVGGEQTTPLPATFDPTEWYHLSIDEDVSHPGKPIFRITLTDRNRDPLAEQERSLSAVYDHGNGSVGFITENAHADFDNITTATLSTHVAPPQRTPPLGKLLSAYSDEFNGSLGPQWSWIREDATKHAIVNGQLKLIVNGDLYRNSNNATNLLLEKPPTGDYVMETKITFDPNNNYQQAGLLVYSDDDHYIKVGPFHGNSLSKILSGYENLLPLPSGDATCDVQPSSTSNIAIKTYTRNQCPNEGEAWDNISNPKPTLNGSTASNPTVTDWLRIYRHGNVYTPYSSLDGQHWVKGQAWNLSAAAANFPVKIGLFAFSGGSFNDVPAYFDYVRLYSQP